MRTNDRGHTMLVAEGYEFERTCEAPGAGGDAATGRERVLVLRSPMHAAQQATGLEKRLCHAETQLTDEATLVAAMARVLKEHRVEGLLSVTWEKQVEQTTQ